MSVRASFILILLIYNYIHTIKSFQQHRSKWIRSLSTDDNPYNKQVYVIAGNFSLDGEMLNFAQYDVATDSWVKKYEAELSSVEYHGVILDVVSNHSINSFSDKLYVVGTFDTMTSTSQMQFCSVGAWNGNAFEKVGEGLCPRGNSASAMITKIYAITLGSDGDLFVGGSFESRMWDGKKFINIQHLARFYGPSSAWLPLSEGSLTNMQAAHNPSVRALAWNPVLKELYIGGDFDSLEGVPQAVGLSIWREDMGLVSFPTFGAYVDDLQQAGGTVYHLHFEELSSSLFVAGTFRWIGGLLCPSVAVWHRLSNNWTCLHQPLRSMTTITALMLHGKRLFAAGWAAPSSDWNGRQWQSNYAIAILDIEGYIKEKLSARNVSTSSPTDRIRGRRRVLKSYVNLFDRVNKRHHISAQAYRSPSPTLSPTRTPQIPWTPHWQWLDGYSGGNGPIVKLVPGNYDLLGCLFIVGAFNNYQSVLIWCNDTLLGPTITAISPNHTIEGLITSIIQLSMAIEYSPTPAPVLPPTPGVVIIDRSHAVLLVLTFIILLIAVITLVIIRNRQGYSPLSNRDDDGSRSSKPDGESDLTFPLTTLSGRMDNSVDFRATFERAMQARHLPSHESLLIIDPREVILKKSIGEGSFGRVWSGYWRNNAVAIKEFVFAQSAIVGGSVDRNNIIDEIVGEAGIMACLRHPKILQVYGCSLTMQAIWILSELCNRGSLRMVLNDKGVELTWLKKLSICVDVADGMLYLHTRNPPIIHRDLKSHNIFVIETVPGHLIAKIGDWGSARALALSGAKSMTQGVGTACWLAPEVINNAHFSKESDVYAFGILLWEIYTRQEVHDRLSAAQIIAKVAHEGLRPPVPRNCPWAELMTSCWKQNNRQRPGFNKILTELSAMYSAAKANARLQHMVASNQLKVNVPEFDQEDTDLVANRPNRARSSPGLLTSTSKDGETELDAKIHFDSSDLKPYAQSTPITVLSSGNTPVIEVDSQQPTSLIKDKSSGSDSLKIDRDVVLIEQIDIKDHSQSNRIANSSSGSLQQAQLSSQLSMNSSESLRFTNDGKMDEGRRTPHDDIMASSTTAQSSSAPISQGNQSTQKKIPQSYSMSSTRSDNEISNPIYSADGEWIISSDSAGYDIT